MTRAARSVLEDCVAAKDALRYGIQGSEWRRAWVTAIVLLRGVGHVLDKIDGESDAQLRIAIDRKWDEAKPPIFTEFIDRERNNIVKEYRIELLPVS